MNLFLILNFIKNVDLYKNTQPEFKHKTYSCLYELFSYGVLLYSFEMMNDLSQYILYVYIGTLIIKEVLHGY